MEEKKSTEEKIRKNPWVWAAAGLWHASLKNLGFLKRLAEAAGTTPASIGKAADKMRI